jgi:hypothetical protein
MKKHHGRNKTLEKPEGMNVKGHVGPAKAGMGSSHHVGKNKPTFVSPHGLHKGGKTHPTFDADRDTGLEGTGHGHKGGGLGGK